MKTYKSILMVALLLTSSLSLADVFCQSRKFIGETEELSIQDALSTNPKISWMHADDYSQLAEAIKYGIPTFSDEIIGVDFMLTKSSCVISSEEKVLNNCGAHSLGDESKLEDIHIHVKSGKDLVLKGIPDVWTNVVRRHYLDANGKTNVYETFEAILQLELHMPGSKPVYSNIENMQNIYCK